MLQKEMTTAVLLCKALKNEPVQLRLWFPLCAGVAVPFKFLVQVFFGIGILNVYL